MTNAINQWPLEERPREKLFRHGAHQLSNSELIAILIGTGNRKESALELGRKVVCHFKTFRKMSQFQPEQWETLKGIGKAKQARIQAALEIARRFLENEAKDQSIQITTSQAAASFLMPRMRDLKKEVFKILLLDSQNSLLEIVEITEGTVNQAFPVVREILKKALEFFASGLLCAHNHPSGAVQPSEEDKCFTQDLKKACHYMQVRFLDHLIIGDNQYFSFADENLL